MKYILNEDYKIRWYVDFYLLMNICDNSFLKIKKDLYIIMNIIETQPHSLDEIFLKLDKDKQTNDVKEKLSIILDDLTRKGIVKVKNGL